jgi:FSR family fosmidomycin resistance protein-like MFS transporter
MSPESLPRRRWAILVIFMIAHAVTDGFIWIIPPLLPALRQQFQLSYTEAGALYSLYRFWGDILQAPVAYIVHLVPAHALIAGGLVWSSVGMALASFSLTYGMLAGLFALSGAGRATYRALAAAVLSRAFGRESRARAIALHMSGSSIGQVLAPFLVGVLLTSYGWRLPLLLWPVLGLFTGGSLFFSLKKQQGSLATGAKPLRLPFFSRPMAVYLLAISFWGIAQSGLMTFLPLFLVDRRGFSKEKAAAIYGMMSLAGALLRPLVGSLMDRMGRRKPILIGGFILCGLSILGLTSLPSSWVMYACVVALGTFGSGQSGLSEVFLIEMIPSDRREESLGFMFTIRMGIAALSPIIVGFFSERSSMDTVFLVLSAVPFLTALILTRAEEKPMD